MKALKGWNAIRLRLKRHTKKEQGAVLLTTLLLMTVMAAIAVSIMDDIRFSVKRQISVQAAEQADWYVRGGEGYARSWLLENKALGRTQLNTALKLNDPIVFPIENDQGKTVGDMRLFIQDAQNCFNVNRLARPKSQKRTRRNLIRLLDYLHIEELDAERVAASIQDWVDADTLPAVGGAEDGDYSGLVPPYHPANTLMVDITELRAINGITEPIYRQISPFLCAHPDRKISQINLNTLTDAQWPLLAQVFGEDDAAARAAQAVIALRPEAGYETTKAVWELPIVDELELKGVGLNMVSIRTNLINVDVVVSLYKNGKKAPQVVTPVEINGTDVNTLSGNDDANNAGQTLADIGFSARRSMQFKLNANSGVALVARRGAF